MLKKSTTPTSGAVVEKRTNFNAKPNAEHTKIPLKRTPIVKHNVPSTSPVIGKHQMENPTSKLGIPLRYTETNKSSVANISNLTLSKTKSAMPNSPKGTKVFAARDMQQGITRRSVSSNSYRIARSQKSEDTPLSPPSARTITVDNDHGHNLNLSARERVAENNKIRVFEGMQKKLQDMQSDFLQKFENLKMTSADKMKYNFKFVTLIKNDECKLLVKNDDLMRLPKKLPLDSVADLKNKIRGSMDKCLIDLVEQVKEIHASTAAEGTSLSKLNEIQNVVDNQQKRLLTEINEMVNLLCSGTTSESDAQIVKMQKELQDGHKTIKELENKFAEIRDDKDNELQSLEHEIKEKYENEISKKDQAISDLQNKLKSSEKLYEKLCNTIKEQRADDVKVDNIEKLQLEDDLRACKDNIHSLYKKLHITEQNLSAERKEKQEKTEHNHRLEGELDNLRKKLDEQRVQHDEKSAHQIKEKQKEIVRLRKDVSNLENEKKELEIELSNSKEECIQLNDLRKKLQSAESQIFNLQEDLNARDFERNDPNSWPIEIQNEMERCRQSESAKQIEVQSLKMDLSKAHFNICQLEEQINRDQQLLKVRAELITSLQGTNNNQSTHLDEMFVQIAEKNNTINEVGLNAELRIKSEDFQNVFSTLTTKQMELLRQENIIKLLEENNERNQMMRVKQEEKIARLEGEIGQIKQSHGIYQNHVIGNPGNRNFLFASMPANDEYNENFNYYANERRRKRQVDINVKKYEI